MQLLTRRPLGAHPLLLIGLVLSLLALAACQPIRDPAVIAAQATAMAGGAPASAPAAPDVAQEPSGIGPAMATISATSLRVRAVPSDTAEVVAGAKQGETYKVIGISSDGSWIQIEIDRAPDGTGWVSASFVTLEGDITNIATVEVDAAMLAAAEAATAEPAVAPTKAPAEEPTVEATAVPAEEPAATPTEEAVEEPTAEATPEPTAEATPEPTEEPVAEATPEPTEEPVAEATQTPAEEAPAEAATSDIMTLVANDSNFSTLASALQAAGLTDALTQGSKLGDVTLFAPTNAAFEAMGQAAIDALMADPTGALAQVLLEHVIPGKVVAADLSDGLQMTTLHGSMVRFAVFKGGMMINGSNILGADVPASNGVIHIIDALLLPPNEVPVEATPEPTAEATPAAMGTITINSDLPLRVRSEPTTEVENKIGNVFDGETYTVLEVSTDGAWVRIDVPQLGVENGGWISTEFVVFN